jgi:hypothetical protein
MRPEAQQTLPRKTDASARRGGLLVVAAAWTLAGAACSAPQDPSAADEIELFAGAAAAPAARLHYLGGYVISHVEIVVVLWGPSVSSSVTGNIESFYKAVIDSPYFDWLGEYDPASQPGMNTHQRIHHGTSVTVKTISPAVASGTVTDVQIRAELQKQIAAAALPAPSVDATDGTTNTLYMLYFPPGLTIDQGGGKLSCRSWCAYHGHVKIAGAPSSGGSAGGGGKDAGAGAVVSEADAGRDALGSDGRSASPDLAAGPSPPPDAAPSTPAPDAAPGPGRSTTGSVSGTGGETARTDGGGAHGCAFAATSIGSHCWSTQLLSALVGGLARRRRRPGLVGLQRW